ncbi:alkylhydroperoxidase like protein, AhpD family [Paludibacter propionicigenes WB4]|uniref:Alkylhydroperoxidase like protein, AhpD family n=1 Tax=Paludibacter propionicigenes (strain DSM 17365 / JCM 13257 / WB4) TaxID=694427 RepID=E4T8L7_PALPW|nr:carboxymuconolactone decarboxylase family protein [Paludibacter propionicigenes]ADQ81126.1 alkylhydroperoxidase like protein, AhpD family [Paludibacter propionicigenes WB4]
MTMKQRINIKRLEPKAYEVLYAMEKYLSATDLSIQLRELIKVRVSQINKCAFCIEMHTKDARKEGETEQRLYALSAWEESPLFTDEEKAVLAMVEEITKIFEHGVSDRTFQNIQNYFTDNQIAQIIIAINQMNFWNRIAVSTKMFHP